MFTFINTDLFSDTGAAMYSILTSAYKQPCVLFENHKIGFEVTINIQSGAKWPLTTIVLALYAIYIKACLLTKQNFFWCFDAGLEHMATRSRGNGTNFDWLM